MIDLYKTSIIDATHLVAMVACMQQHGDFP